MKRKVISIGYGRNLFTADNPERLRMELCAKETDGFEMIIFTHRLDRFETTTTHHNLTLHPTRALCKVDMPLRAFFIARRIIKKSPTPYVVTTQDPFETGLIGVLLKYFYGTRLVVQEHGDVLGSHHWRNESLLNHLRYRVGWFVLQRADIIRVVSERTKNYFLQNGLQNIVTLPVAITVQPFISATPDPSVRTRFSTGTFLFLTTARLVPQKNLLLLLRAFKNVYNECPQARLLIVGSGSEAARLKKFVATHFPPDDTIVAFIPWSNNVPGLMKAADAYVLSSNYEGWGRVLVEAISAKLPVVTTDVGCVGEAFLHGTHGLVVPVGDETLLTQAMLRLMNDNVLYVHIKTMLNSQTLTIGSEIEEYGVRWIKTLE